MTKIIFSPRLQKTPRNFQKAFLDPSAPQLIRKYSASVFKLHLGKPQTSTRRRFKTHTRNSMRIRPRVPTHRGMNDEEALGRRIHRVRGHAPRAHVLVLDPQMRLGLALGGEPRLAQAAAEPLEAVGLEVVDEEGLLAETLAAVDAADRGVRGRAGLGRAAALLHVPAQLAGVVARLAARLEAADVELRAGLARVPEVVQGEEARCRRGRFGRGRGRGFGLLLGAGAGFAGVLGRRRLFLDAGGGGVAVRAFRLRVRAPGGEVRTRE